MPVFEIRDAKPFHVGQIVRSMRTEHRDSIIKLGINTHKQIHTIYNNSAFSRSWFIDGKLAGIGGIIGSVLSSKGFVWLALSQDSLRYPVALVKEAKNQLHEGMKTYLELQTTILCNDEAAQRFADFLGFCQESENEILKNYLIRKKGVL